MLVLCFFFLAEDGIRDAQESRGLGDVYKRQDYSHGREACQEIGSLPSQLHDMNCQPGAINDGGGSCQDEDPVNDG